MCFRAIRERVLIWPGLRRSLSVLALLLAATAHADPQLPPKDAPKGVRGPQPLGGLADEIRVRAERQGGETGHFWWEGFVDLQSGDIRIQADHMQYEETDKPDGTKAHRVVADGNVVFMKDEERLSGAHLDMDLDTGKGFTVTAVAEETAEHPLAPVTVTE